MLAVSLADCRSDSVPSSSTLPLLRRPFTLANGISSRLPMLSCCPGSCFSTTSTICIASFSVSPVSSMAARNRASSLHSSQSPSLIALDRTLTDWSADGSSSSKVCKIMR